MTFTITMILFVLNVLAGFINVLNDQNTIGFKLVGGLNFFVAGLMFDQMVMMTIS